MDKALFNWKEIEKELKTARKESIAGAEVKTLYLCSGLKKVDWWDKAVKEAQEHQCEIEAGLNGDLNDIFLSRVVN